MNSQELEHIFKHLASLLAAGKDHEARAYLNEQLPKLPEDIRNDIMFEMFTEAIQEEARDRQAIAKLQEESITAIRSMQETQKEIEEDHHKLNPHHPHKHL